MCNLFESYHCPAFHSHEVELFTRITMQCWEDCTLHNSREHYILESMTMILQKVGLHTTCTILHGTHIISLDVSLYHHISSVHHFQRLFSDYSSVYMMLFFSEVNCHRYNKIQSGWYFKTNTKEFWVLGQQRYSCFYSRISSTKPSILDTKLELNKCAVADLCDFLEKSP